MMTSIGRDERATDPLAQWVAWEMARLLRRRPELPMPVSNDPLRIHEPILHSVIRRRPPQRDNAAP